MMHDPACDFEWNKRNLITLLLRFVEKIDNDTKQKLVSVSRQSEMCSDVSPNIR